ncbi:MAG TPA: molecular chaperone DnaK, partial [Coleofasciculaceae cyanobacterium]
LKDKADGLKQQIQSAITTPSATVSEVKQQIEEFQQTLFAIGNLIYTYANAGQSSDPDEFKAEDEDTPTQIYNPHDASTSEEGELDFNFDEDTATADYEAVD